ncbi:PepSY-associated TM helix domain-containing protein [Bradyrhizobium sp. ARR65]|uniref:PepSY-associated TM helix domain-containing protein n=1 Tax=Bradyrhizobium sp. ARR65 TaxID=1040989 RepID=UPI00046581FD|nr:PepSY-associated TM helix domain-containing protein [Bradyrhizobium sp. ARR65]
MNMRAIKPALLQVHSIIGLAFSLVLALMGITGATMSFEDEIEAYLNAGLMRVEARPTPRLTPDELIARLRAAGGVGKVSAVTLSSNLAVAARVRFVRSEDSSRPSSVYVDPYDAHVLGKPRGEDFFVTIRKLHRWLLLPGDGNGYGRTITGITTVCLVVLLISGLVLRWPPRAGSVKMWLKPNLMLRGRGLHRSLHAVVGTWVLPIYLVIASTGLWYSFEWYRNGATWLLSRPTAAMTQPKPPRGTGTADGRAIALDRAWSTFLHEQGSRFATAQLTLPAGAGTIVRIRSWVQGVSHEGARDEFRVDAVTGQILSSEIYADKTIGERILSSVLDIHRGSILGWPGKLLFMLAAGLMPLFMITGILLYLSRRKLKRVSRQPLRSLVPGE